MPGKRKIVLDIETGDLPVGAPVIEVAWWEIGPDGMPLTATPDLLVFPHDPRAVNPIAAEVNKYYERSLYDPHGWADEFQIGRFYDDLYGATIVGCNPAFDTAHLTAAAQTFGARATWHYRMLDIESMAYGLLDFTDVPGLISIRAALNEMGYDIQEPDHSALYDVIATYQCYAALCELRNRAVT